MSDKSLEGMSDEDFKLCLDALNRSAENSRSTFFAYVVIYGAFWSGHSMPSYSPRSSSRSARYGKSSLIQ